MSYLRYINSIPQDNTFVNIINPISPVRRIFSNPEIEQQYNLYLQKRPWDLTGAEQFISNLEKQQSQILSQGKESTKEEKEASEARVKQQDEIEKREKDKQKTAEVIDSGLNYLSPTYWYNQMVTPENQITSDAGQFIGDILLDPTTYLTAGIAPAAKGAAKKSVSKAVRKTVKDVAKKTDVTENFIKFTGIPKVDDPKYGLNSNKIKYLEDSKKAVAEKLQENGVDLSQISIEHINAAADKRRSLLRELSKEQRLVISETRNPVAIGDRGNLNTLMQNGYSLGYIKLSTQPGKPDKVDYIVSEIPGEKVGLDLYDSAIRTAQAEGRQGVQSGELLMSADKTTKTWEHYPNRQIIGNNGVQYFSDKPTKKLTHQPIVLLTEPARNIPVKSVTFNPTTIDENGIMHINLQDPDIYKSLLLPWLTYNSMKKQNDPTTNSLKR